MSGEELLESKTLEAKALQALPAGACDCHCHVFGPAARFPYAEPRTYTPDDAPLEVYIALLDRLGTIALAGEPARASSTFVGGLKTLPLRFTAA